MIVFSPLLWWIMWREDFDGMRTESQIKRRSKLTVDIFYEQFYAGSDIPKSTIVRLLEITAEQFGVDRGQIRPDDNFLRSTLGDTMFYVIEISEEFGIPDRISDGDQNDGTFDNIARWVTPRRALYRMAARINTTTGSSPIKPGQST